MTARETVLRSVRRGLGRSATPLQAPSPPAIEEHITRLVRSGIGLPDLFARMARQNLMLVEAVSAGELALRLIDFLRSRACRRVAIADGALSATLLTDAGFEVRRWSGITLDELYDFDCAVTDVHAAIAETGSLVVRGSAGHGRALSLVPPIHVAIVRQDQILADLVDLFAALCQDTHPSNIVIITGPSKTADIEMNLVTGVHGPGVVQVFMVQ